MKRYTFRKEKPRDGIFHTWEYDYAVVLAHSFEAFEDHCLDLECAGFKLFTITKV